MRVSPSIVLAGFFWLPAQPERRSPGTLTISDGGKIRLDVLGYLGEEPKLFAPARTFPRIVGEVENHGDVTLEQCFAQHESPDWGRISKSAYHVHHVFLGVVYDEGETVLLNSLAFAVDGLDEWHGITGLKIDYRVPAGASINYERPEPRRLWSADSMGLDLKFGWTPPALPALTSATIRQQSMLVLRSETARPLEDFLIVVHKLVNFFALAIDQAVSMREVSVTSSTIREGGANGDQFETTIGLYFESRSFVEKIPTVNSNTMLFNFEAFSDRTQAVFAAWLEAHERVMPAMNLFFSARAGPHKYLNSRFLWTAQALETYHRRTSSDTQMPEEEFAKLKQIVVEATPVAHREFVEGKFNYANEPMLAKRLGQMVAMFGVYFGEAKARKSLIWSIVNTRNYYTHYDPRSEKGAAHGEKLWELCMRMEALFQLQLMKEIGFSNEAIAGVVKGFSSLRHKLPQPPPPAGSA